MSHPTSPDGEAGTRAMTAEPTPGPYEIWGEDEQMPGVPCIEIGRGEIPSPEAKSLCLVQSTLDEQTDEFVLTPEDWANANLLAASWATAAERDRLRDKLEAAERVLAMDKDQFESVKSERDRLKVVNEGMEKALEAFTEAMDMHLGHQHEIAMCEADDLARDVLIEARKP